MPSTSEMQSEIPDSIHRRGIGYFSVSSARVDSRQEIERYVQNNLAAWGQTYGPGQPYVLYNHAAGRYELEWHRPKTVQEQDREARYEQQRLIAQTQQRYANAQMGLAAQQAAYSAQLARAQVNTYAALYGSSLQASFGSAQPSAGMSVSVPRRHVDTPSLWTRLKVFFIALLTGASPFRVYWEMKHALRV
jgi:hypothetical protein